MQNVKTYFQSGNVTFGSTDLDTPIFSEDLRSAINERFGFTPQVLVTDGAAFEKIITNNPFPDAEAEPKALGVIATAGNWWTVITICEMISE